LGRAGTAMRAFWGGCGEHAACPVLLLRFLAPRAVAHGCGMRSRWPPRASFLRIAQTGQTRDCGGRARRAARARLRAWVACARWEVRGAARALGEALRAPRLPVLRGCLPGAVFARTVCGPVPSMLGDRALPWSYCWAAPDTAHASRWHPDACKSTLSHPMISQGPACAGLLTIFLGAVAHPAPNCLELRVGGIRC